jgi:hypothetical protein
MKLTHPCKETCSGYSQDCAEQVAALEARVKALEQQLHECGQSELKHDIRADELAIENAKLRKIVDAARDCLWIDECHCDLAYTARGRHAPNKRCGELDPIREALRELDGDHE